jgi:formylglycine-generating enzyme required for sulfatase activity
MLRVASPVFPQDKSKGGMVLIPGSTFDLGTDRADIPRLLKAFNITRADIFSSETPRHRVRIDSFYMDTHEVTNAQFKQFVDKSPQWQAANIPARLHNGKYLKHWNGNEFPEGLADHPVVNVSWYAAVAYCHSRGKRLPTEAEWDFAARGGLSGKMFPWGDEPADKDRANYSASGLGAARSVGSYAPNGYGLYDMAGNVWEYTADEWKSYPADTSLQVNPVAGGNFFLDDSYLQITTRRVIRGGSWGGAPLNLRYAYRDSHPAEGAGDHVGFRCVQPVGSNAIKLSAGRTVTTDGKIDDNEWLLAASFDLKGGGKVFFRYDGEYLYVGVRGNGNGWSHLYLGGDDRILVLHASAALGKTTYRLDKDQKWQPSNPFSWDMRDRTVTPETLKKMDDYLLKNFWVANNNNMGNENEIEFKVKPQTGAVRVAVVYASDAKNPEFFPETLRDDTLKEDLIRGNTPSDLKFEPAQWANIILEEKAK